MESWQEELTSSRERLLSRLLKNGDMSDVTFIVGNPPEEKEFKLHKLIISMCSDVFYTMFYGSLSEDSLVHVPDIEPEIFEIAIKYMYEESFSVVSMKEAIHTYLAAEKYNLDDLKKTCIFYIYDNITSQNIPFLYNAPNIIEDLKIESKCKDLISKNTSEILNSDHFINCPLEMLKDMDSLDVESEAKLFEYLLKWAKSNCDKVAVEIREKALRETMLPLLPNIYFLAMKIEEFLSGPGESNILTENEMIRISKYLAGVSSSQLPDWCNKRSVRGYDATLDKRLPLYDDDSCTSNCRLTNVVSQTIRLVERNITLRGVTLYALCASHDISSPSFSSLCIDQGYSLRIKANCIYDGITKLLTLKLINPMLLRPDKPTTIILNAWKGISFCACKCRVLKKGTKLKIERKRSFISEDTGSSHFYEIIFSEP